MWQALLKPIVGSVVDGVVTGIKEAADRRQIDRMQAEVLEGWLFKLKIAVERELREKDISHEVYKEVMAAIDAVVIAEFDVDKL